VRWTHDNGLKGSDDTRTAKELVTPNTERASAVHLCSGEEDRRNAEPGVQVEIGRNEGGGARHPAPPSSLGGREPGSVSSDPSKGCRSP
jgi:hypothetical protein